MPVIDVDYRQALRDSQAMGEENDCAVIAVTVATGLPYKVVHVKFEINGRERRKGTPWDITEKTLRDLKFKPEEVDVVPTTVKLLEEKRPAHIHLVRVVNHILALRDGVVMDDLTKGRNKIVKHAYTLTKLPPASTEHGDLLEVDHREAQNTRDVLLWERYREVSEIIQNTDLLMDFKLVLLTSSGSFVHGTHSSSCLTGDEFKFGACVVFDPLYFRYDVEIHDAFISYKGLKWKALNTIGKIQTGDKLKVRYTTDGDCNA